MREHSDGQQQAHMLAEHHCVVQHANLLLTPDSLPGLLTQETSLTNVGLSWMPALASTMEDLGSCWKSVLTTSSSVYLQAQLRC